MNPAWDWNTGQCTKLCGWRGVGGWTRTHARKKNFWHRQNDFAFYIRKEKKKRGFGSLLTESVNIWWPGKLVIFSLSTQIHHAVQPLWCSVWSPSSGSTSVLLSLTFSCSSPHENQSLGTPPCSPWTLSTCIVFLSIHIPDQQQAKWHWVTPAYTHIVYECVCVHAGFPISFM